MRAEGCAPMGPLRCFTRRGSGLDGRFLVLKPGRGRSVPAGNFARFGPQRTARPCTSSAPLLMTCSNRQPLFSLTARKHNVHAVNNA
jgi:hypothetical protein